MNRVKRAAQLSAAPQKLFRRCISYSCIRRQEVSSSGASDKSGDEDRKYLHLRGFPRSATPADVLRFVRRNVKDDELVRNIASAQLDYNRFIPTGRAYVILTSGFYAKPVLQHLLSSHSPSSNINDRITRDSAKSASPPQMSTLPIRAFHSPLTPAQLRQRRRGADGRKDASERGVLDGLGFGAGIDPKGKDVVIYGLPGSIAAPALRLYLRRMRLVKSGKDGEPDCQVIKIGIPRKTGFSAISKHLVRLNSPEEAQAFVRKMHMTFFLPEVWQHKFLVRARVVY